MMTRVLLVFTVCFASACGGATESTSQPDQSQGDKVARSQPVEQATRAAGTAVEDEVALPLPPLEPVVPARALAKHADEQHPDTQPVRPAAFTESGVSVARQPNGEPVLLVNCPWGKYPRPSIQIMLVLDEKVDLSSLQPLELDGVAAESLWSQQVESLNKPTDAASNELVKTTTAFIEYNDRKLLKHRARENSLGRASAYALAEQLGTLLVFYRLEHWVDDKGAFRLTLADIDLPSKFASPGRIRVWLLSEEKVVWSADATWPGKQPADQQPTAGKTPVSEPAATKPAAPDTTPSQIAPKSVAPKSVAPKAAQAATAPKPVEPKAVPKTDDKNSATDSATPKTWVKSPGTGPALSPADSKPSLPATVKPAAPVTPKIEPKKPVDIEKMTVDELANHIEQTWGSTMSKPVRKSWVAGWNNYYQVENPFTVRRAVFLSLLKTCHTDQPPGKLRDALAALYFKLKQLNEEPRKN